MEAKIKLWETRKDDNKSYDKSIRKMNNKNNSRNKRESSKKIKLKIDINRINMFPPIKNQKKRKNKQNLYMNNNILMIPSNLKTKSFDSKGNAFQFSKSQIDEEYFKILKYTNNELNSLTYKEALIYDKRSFFEYYLSLIRTNHLIVSSFYTNNDFNLIFI